MSRLEALARRGIPSGEVKEVTESELTGPHAKLLPGRSDSLAFMPG